MLLYFATVYCISSFHKSVAKAPKPFKVPNLFSYVTLNNTILIHRIWFPSEAIDYV